jgi:hypothetical protein
MWWSRYITLPLVATSDSADRGRSIIRVIKSAENLMRSNLELLPVINAKSRPRYISALKKVVHIAISTIVGISSHIKFVFFFFRLWHLVFHK